MKCPECGREIDTLNHTRRTMIRGEYSLIDGVGVDYWDEGDQDYDSERNNYYCPECEEQLFQEECEAEAFLKGEASE
jgi:Zn finger protein HypA/HybF involved in hydrogenase expression